MVQFYKSILFFAAIVISIGAHGQCNAPTNLNVVYSNNVSTFTWDSVPGASGYNFELKFAYDTWPFGSSFSTSTNSYQLVGLYHSAELEWRVNTVCGTTISPYSASVLYNVPCPQPSALYATNLTDSSATVNWTAAAGYNTNVSNFAVRYRLANTNNTWISAGYTSGTSKTITGLNSNSTYEYSVHQSCLNSNSTPMVAQFTTTFVSCNKPTNVTVTGVSANQATINWTGVSGAQTYTVEYKPAVAANWIAANPVTANTILLTGLTQATLYDVRVKTNCTNNTSSIYSTSQFTTYTSNCTAYGVNGSEYIDRFSLGTINRVSGREIGGYINTGLSTNLVKGSNTNAGVISAGFNPGIVFGENYAVYIDFNNNGTFTDNGERVAGPTYFVTGSDLNFNIVVPNNASLGNRKMRVVVRRSTSSIAPCATGFQGEVEDYIVRIVSNKSAPAMNEVAMEDVLVFPNPTNGLFQVTTTEKFHGAFVEVLDLNGKSIDKREMGEALSISMDLTDQPNGVYLVQVVSDDNTKSLHRILITK